MNWLQLGGSIVAILVLAGIAWGLKLGGAAAFASEGEARQRAENDLSGFHSVSAWLSHDGYRAVVFGSDGGIALIRPHGAHHVTRRVGTATSRRLGQFVEIDSHDPAFGTFSIRLASHEQAIALARALAATEAGTITDTRVGNAV